MEGCVPRILTLSHSFPTRFLSFLFLSLPLHPLSSPRLYSRPQRSSSVSSDPLFPCCQSSVAGTSRFGIRSHARRYSDLTIPSSLKLLARAHCGDLAHQRTESAPRIHQGTRTEGLHTSIQKPLCRPLLLHQKERRTTTPSPGLQTIERMDHTQSIPSPPHQ